MSSKSTWARCETISKQTKKIRVYVDPGASVPTAQDNLCTRYISKQIVAQYATLCLLFSYFHSLWDGVKRSQLAVPRQGQRELP